VSVSVSGYRKLWQTLSNAFKEAGVTIAFPQRDVHLDATSPLEVRVVSTPSGSEAENGSLRHK